MTIQDTGGRRTGSLLDNRYQLERQISKGPRSVVYRAVDQHLGRPVAIKLLRPEYAADSEAVERFRREVTAVASLSHPNIAVLYDWRSEGSTCYAVLELVEGETLAELIDRRGALPSGEVVGIARQVLAGLAAAHAVGMVHRDVKPQNVLVGKDGVAKLIDFGIAQVKGLTPLTQIGMAIGTPAYVSPEQAQGLPVTAATDIYSLGIVLYEMLAGRPPFVGETDSDILMQRVHSKPPPLRKFAAGLPQELERILARALAQRPEDRWPSALEMSIALERCAGLATEATRPLRFVPPPSGLPTAASTATADAPTERFLVIPNGRAPSHSQQDSVGLESSLAAASAPGRGVRVSLASAIRESAVLLLVAVPAAAVCWGTFYLVNAFVAPIGGSDEARMRGGAAAFGAIVGIAPFAVAGLIPTSRDKRWWRAAMISAAFALALIALAALPPLRESFGLAPQEGRWVDFLVIAAASTAAAMLLARLVVSANRGVFLGLVSTVGWVIVLVPVVIAGAALAWGMMLLVGKLLVLGGLSAGQTPYAQAATFGLVVGLAPSAANGLVRGGWGRSWRSAVTGALLSLAMLVLAVSPPRVGFRPVGLEPADFLTFAAIGTGLTALVRGLLIRTRQNHGDT